MIYPGYTSHVIYRLSGYMDVGFNLGRDTDSEMISFDINARRLDVT